MRFVDIDQLDLPPGWHERADQALAALRDEIEQAERLAVELGEDPVLARRSAISRGLDMPSRTRIWRDLAPILAALARDKCWYSESLNPTSDDNVDHFRPKKRVEGEPAHEGYWWLAFDWTNYRYSSQWCNQRRVDDLNGTSGGKWDQFPLCPESFRARQEGDDIELEKPELLDPVDPDDWRLLTFLPDGTPTPAKDAERETVAHQRAARSIEVYHLHCRKLVNDRKALAGSIKRLVEVLERLRRDLDDGTIRRVYKNQQKELLRAISPYSAYSAAALAYARAEVYKVDRGNLVKRDWLEELLS